MALLKGGVECELIVGESGYPKQIGGQVWKLESGPYDTEIECQQSPPCGCPNGNPPLRITVTWVSPFTDNCVRIFGEIFKFSGSSKIFCPTSYACGGSSISCWETWKLNAGDSVLFLSTAVKSAVLGDISLSYKSKNGNSMNTQGAAFLGCTQNTNNVTGSLGGQAQGASCTYGDCPTRVPNTGAVTIKAGDLEGVTISWTPYFPALWGNCGE